MADQVFLRLFHGRDDPDQEMDDWGFEGPILGPLRYVHITYMSDVKFEMERSAFERFFPEEFKKYHAQFPQEWIEGQLDVAHGLIAYGGKFYGDLSVAHYFGRTQGEGG